MILLFGSFLSTINYVANTYFVLLILMLFHTLYFKSKVGTIDV